MPNTIDLVLLKCLKCGNRLEAEEEEIAWVCGQCGQGQQLTEAGLETLPVNWAAPRSGTAPSSAQWRPFWVFSGGVSFRQRESYGRNNAPDALWNNTVRFFVPAYPASLETLEQLGAKLTREQPALRPGPPAGPLSGCTLLPEDARQAAEFIVLTIEADRKDKLKSVSFHLELGEPELWLLPLGE